MKKTILSLMLITSSIFAMEGKTMTVYKSHFVVVVVTGLIL